MNIEERAANYGPKALSDRELLGAIVGDKAASAILEVAGSLFELRRWKLDDFRQYCTRKRSVALISMLEAGIRSIEEPERKPTMDTPEIVARYMRPLCHCLEVEYFWALCLDRKNRLLRRTEVTKGTATNSLVHAREVFREAIKLNATAIIAVHNHPSGDPAPSRADIHVTRQLREAAKVIGIDLIDHIIIGQRNADPHCVGHYSFNDAGLV